MATKKPATPSRIADNKKAAYNYFFEERYECGMVLDGWEVKAIRAGRANIGEAYVIVKDGALYQQGVPMTTLLDWLRAVAKRMQADLDKDEQGIIDKM
mgnify:CR=1 FL=1